VLGFVKSPYAVWDSSDLEHRRMLCAIAFDGPISYCRENGFGTPNLSPGFALFREIEGTCFRNVRMTDDNWNEDHFNRFGKIPQSDMLRRVLKNCQVAFEKWVLDSHKGLQAHTSLCPKTSANRHLPI
jgi:hypothetical protein